MGLSRNFEQKNNEVCYKKKRSRPKLHSLAAALENEYLSAATSNSYYDKVFF